MKSQYFSILIIHCLYLLLLLTSVTGVYAQPKRLQFNHLTSDDGLSSSTVIAVLQDYKGFMWFGTYEGLNRYDGYNFVIYKRNPADSTSLADNIVRTIMEDHDKNLFIGTQNGLCLYDREKDRFLNYRIDKSSPLFGINCTVLKIAEDSLGNFWLATGIGLIYFDRNNNQITQFTHDINKPASLSDNNVEGVLIDKNHRLWVTTRIGLNLFLPETGTFKHITQAESDARDLSNTYFMEMIEDLEGNLWFGSTEGLYCLKSNPEAKITKLIHYQHDAKDKYSLSSNRIKSFNVDDKGNLWIGTENDGINLFDRENQRFWHYRKDDYDPKSLNNESIEAIYHDKTGNLWVCTFTGGLNIAIKNRDAISSYQTLPGAPFSLSHSTVTCFLEDHLGQIWLGTDGGGLNLFDKQTNRFLHFNKDNSNLSSNAILCIIEDSNNQIWIGTWGGGLIHFDSKTKSFKSFIPGNSGIQDNSIYAIAEGENNDLWLGSFEHGLIRYQIKEKKFTDYTPDNSGLANKMIIKIEKYSKDRFLLGSTNCFQIFSPGEDRFITYMPDPNDSNSLSYSTTTDILVENDSCVWIGTHDGLNLFNPKTGSFKRYYEGDGLPSSLIKGLVLDESGDIWVTTNKGLCRFDYKQGRFKNFTKADGLQSNEFYERSILKTKSGELLMGGTKGFNMVYPEKITENKSIPDVLITDLKIFNKSVLPDAENSPLIQNITETKTLTLSHKESVLTFYFAVMDFTASEKNQYAYKMEGFDKDWIYSGNKREATYTNLSSGEYVFHVKGSNNDGLWNEKGVSLGITILPPWWNTWLFRIIIFLVIVFILASIYLSRIKHLKNQKILLEKLVAAKTVEVQEKNATLLKQAEELNETNTLLEERQQLVEEQSKRLEKMNSELTEKNLQLEQQAMDLNETNNLLEERQQQIEEQREELYELNATKDKFFSIIAHDLKNPFNVILGFSELVVVNFEKWTDEKKHQVVNLIFNASKNLYQLLENLLQWSRSQRGILEFNPERIELKDILPNVVDLLKDTAEAKSIELELMFPKEGLAVHADRQMLDTILRNLISNAIKFSNTGGKVQIIAEINDGFAGVKVIDNGVGIRSEIKDKLFKIDTHHTTPGTGNEKGTGLGLILAKEFVTRHGGKIGVESTIGEGSTFHFTLPLEK
jgi:ligand-binding sensor domain-containing protein/signal transduction histidine kinase